MEKWQQETSVSGGAVHEQYLYDECNRLLQITDGADTVKNYTYDNSGNMLSDGEIFYLLLTRAVWDAYTDYC